MSHKLISAPSPAGLMPYRLICRIFFILSLCTTGFCTPSFSQSGKKETHTGDARTKPIKLNNKRLETNLRKYADDLDLTSKQVRKIGNIENRFAKKEKKMARKSSTRKKHLKALQQRKRKKIIAVLTYEQQRKLESLSRRGLLDFFR